MDLFLNSGRQVARHAAKQYFGQYDFFHDMNQPYQFLDCESSDVSFDFPSLDVCQSESYPEIIADQLLPCMTFCRNSVTKRYYGSDESEPEKNQRLVWIVVTLAFLSAFYIGRKKYLEEVESRKLLKIVNQLLKQGDFNGIVELLASISDNPIVLGECIRKERSGRQSILFKMLNLIEPVLLEIDPAITSKYFSFKGNILCTLHFPSKALKAYDQAIEKNPHNFTAYNNKAALLIVLRRPEEALHCCDQAIEKDPNASVAYNNKAVLLVALGRPEEALHCYDQAIEKGPNDSVAYNNKAVLLAELGRTDEALHCCDQAIEKGLNDPDTYYHKAVVFAELGRAEEALHCCDQAIKKGPNNFNAYNNKANLLADLGRDEEALHCYDQAIEKGPNDFHAYGNKADLLVELGKIKEALNCYDQAIEKGPNDFNAYNNKALLLVALGRDEEALHCYDQVIKKAPDDFRVYNNKANLLADLGRDEEALHCYDRAIEKGPNDFHAYGNKADLLADLGRDEEALHCYDQAIEKGPNNFKVYNNKANLLADLGRDKEALNCYDQAIEKGLNDFRAYNNKALVLTDLGKTEEALNCYDQAIEKGPNDFNAYYNKANLLVDLGRVKEALYCFNQAIEKGPNDFKAYYSKANLLVKLEKPEEALHYFDQAIEKVPDDFRAYNNKALLLVALGREEEALESYDQAIKKGPNNFKAYNNKANLLANLGRDEEALHCYDQVIKKDPNDFGAYNNKAILLAALGRDMEALHYYDQAIEKGPNNFAAYNNKANLLADLGRDKEALHCYDQAIKKHSTAFEAYYNKAFLLVKLEKNEKALHCYDQAIERDPNDFRAYHNKARLLAKLGKVEEALEYYDQAIEKNPDVVYSYHKKMDLLLKSGRTEEALGCEIALSVNLDKASKTLDLLNSAIRDNEHKIFFMWKKIQLLTHLNRAKEIGSLYQEAQDAIRKQDVNILAHDLFVIPFLLEMGESALVTELLHLGAQSGHNLLVAKYRGLVEKATRIRMIQAKMYQKEGNEYQENDVTSTTNQWDTNFKTALFYAIQHKNHKTVKRLLEDGADVNKVSVELCRDQSQQITNIKYVTPLQQAQALNQWDIVELLLQYHTDENIRQNLNSALIEVKKVCGAVHTSDLNKYHPEMVINAVVYKVVSELLGQDVFSWELNPENKLKYEAYFKPNKQYQENDNSFWFRLNPLWSLCGLESTDSYKTHTALNPEMALACRFKIYFLTWMKAQITPNVNQRYTERLENALLNILTTYRWRRSAAASRRKPYNTSCQLQNAHIANVIETLLQGQNYPYTYATGIDHHTFFVSFLRAYPEKEPTHIEVRIDERNLETRQYHPYVEQYLNTVRIRPCRLSIPIDELEDFLRILHKYKFMPMQNCFSSLFKGNIYDDIYQYPESEDGPESKAFVMTFNDSCVFSNHDIGIASQLECYYSDLSPAEERAAATLGNDFSNSQDIQRFIDKVAKGNIKKEKSYWRASMANFFRIAKEKESHQNDQSFRSPKI